MSLISNKAPNLCFEICYEMNTALTANSSVIQYYTTVLKEVISSYFL